MWPYLQEKPKCIKDPEPASGVARSWTAKLSDERFPFNLEMRNAIRKVGITMETAKTEYEGLWILCDEYGTWAILTYPNPKEAQVATRNLRQILKPLGKEVLATMEKTRRYFNESHQASIERLQIRREIIYKAEQRKAANFIKPKACKQNLAMWLSFQEHGIKNISNPDPDDESSHNIGLGCPPPPRIHRLEGTVSTMLTMPSSYQVGNEVSPYKCSIIRFMDELEDIDITLQKLTNAREQCKAEQDELNRIGGEAESSEHLEYESKHLKVLAYDQEIKQVRAERKRMQATINSMKDDNLVEECDDKHEDVYALWLFGDCGYLQPASTIFVKSMREEKDREEFLKEELIYGEQLMVSMGETDPDIPHAVRMKMSDEALNAVVKKTKQLQDECVFPKDANSHDKARTRKRIANVCESLTGEVPDAKRLKKMLDKEEGCYQCGAKEVRLQWNKEGGPPMCIEKIWCNDPKEDSSAYDLDKPTDSTVLFCTEECCKRYRSWTICGQCNNSDKKNMYIKNKDSILNGSAESNLFLKDYHCNSCNVRCYSRDPSVWGSIALSSEYLHDHCGDYSGE